MEDYTFSLLYQVAQQLLWEVFTEVQYCFMSSSHILVILELNFILYIFSKRIKGDRGGTVVKVLCYKSEGRWFDSRWCQWNFSST